MRLGILAAQNDSVAALVQEHAQRRGMNVLRLALEDLFESSRIHFDGTAWWYDEHDLSSIDALMLRRYPAEVAMLSADPDEQMSAAVWLQRGLRQLEISHTAQSMILDLETNRPTINPLRTSRFADYKPHQLSLLNRNSVPTPKTWVTNDPAKVRALAASQALICKPVSGGAEARQVTPELLEHLDEIAIAPVIFQEQILGTDIRATIVGDEMVSVVEIPSTTLDYRSQPSYRAGAQSYVPHELPPEVVEVCFRAARACSYILTGIDLKRTQDGRYVVLEANSAPVYTDIERKTGAPITASIVRYLENAAENAAHKNAAHKRAARTLTPAED